MASNYKSFSGMDLISDIQGNKQESLVMQEKRASNRSTLFHFVTLISQGAGTISCAINNKSPHGLGLIAANGGEQHFSKIHVGEIVLVRMVESQPGEIRVVRVHGRVAHASRDFLGLSLNV